jgi:GNAT superfamily N-acetyltransferase
VKIESGTLAELAMTDGFRELMDEYAEGAIEGMPVPGPKFDTMDIKGTGSPTAIKAVQDGKLIGFVTVEVPEVAAFNVPPAVSEHFFVVSEHRGAGVELRLLRAAEARARKLGSPGLLISAPFGSCVAEELQRGGYAETSRVLFRKLIDA